MAAQGSNHPGRSSFFSGQTLMVAMVYVLPVLIPALFGWMNMVLAVPAFYVLRVFGTREGTSLLRNGLLLAALGALLLNQVGVFLFSLTMLPLAYSLDRSAALGEGPARAGARGTITLALTWIAFWTIYGITAGMNPYNHLLELLDAGFTQTFEIYKSNTDLPAEVLLDLDRVISELKLLVPRILPGVLACMVLMTVWMNMVAGNTLLLQRNPEKAPWAGYSGWRLPEQLVWLPIIALALTLIGQGRIRDAGICLLLVAGLVYFFQGLAVFIHLLERWKVPRYLRLVFYLLLIIQSYGLILLAVLGIADVWIDFRRMGRNDGQPGEE
ncbi:MAG TPA: DUF2232 domain-containing protein [Desulfobulbus sp.]|nr:DUF2232 domain-containing protein [Desulfobulbus sp.]